MAIITENI